MQSITKELYTELISRLDHGADCASLSCSCRLLHNYHKELKTESQFNPTSDGVMFYANYRLSDHQVEMLQFLTSGDEKKVSFITPTGSGRKVTALIHAKYIFDSGRSAVIAVPSESVSAYVEQAAHLNISVVSFKKIIKSENFSEKAIYVVDRSNTYQSIDLDECNIGCIIIDEPSKGKKSFYNFCEDISLSDKIQAVLFMNSATNQEKECGYFEAYLMNRRGQFVSIKYNLHLSEIKKRVTTLPEIWFYPCLEGAGSYYSVMPQNKTGVWNQDVLQEIVKYRAKKPMVFCLTKKTRLEIEPFVSARYMEINRITDGNMPTGYSDYIFYNYVGTEERLRHIIEKLQLRVSRDQPLKIWIITNTSSLAYSVIPPRSMIESYRQYMEKNEASASGLSSVTTRSYKKGISLEEMTVIARKSSFPSASSDWLSLHGDQTYDSKQIASIVRDKKCIFLGETEPSSIENLEPIIVNQGLIQDVEEEPCEDSNKKELEAIIASPKQKGLATVDELRRRCRLAGICSTGKKQELAIRLLEHHT